MKKLLMAVLAAVCGSVFGEGEVADAKVPLWFYGNAPHATAGESNPYKLINGSIDQFSFYNTKSSYPGNDCSWIFDMGCPRVLTRLRVAPWWKARFALSFYVSADAETWDLWAKFASAETEKVFLDCLPPEACQGKSYRYVKIKSDNNENPACGEIEVYSAGLAVSQNVPNTWSGTTTAMAEESANGIKISGKAYAPTDTSVRVVVCTANEDFDVDYAAWQANGQAHELAAALTATAAGTDYSGYLTGLPSGFTYARVFVIGANETVSSVTRRFVSKAKPAATVKAYINNTASGKASVWVDGVRNGTRLEVIGDWSIATIFDLADYTAQGRYVTAVRLLSRECASRRATARIYCAYDTETPAVWPVTTNLLNTATRRLDYVTTADTPALTWQEVGNFSDSQFNGLADTLSESIEMPLFPSAQKAILREHRVSGRWPRYLKVGYIQANDVVEIELRTSKMPSGLVIVVK